MFSLALKNILFYKARSITTFVLTFVTTLLFIVYVAFMDGSHSSMLKNALKIYTGGIEIYKKGYRDRGGSEYLVENVKEIEEKLQRVKGIKTFASRYESFGLLSFKNYSSASMVTGIEPLKEQKISELKNALLEGSYLTQESGNCLYIGAELLKKLHAKLGSEVSYISSASDESFVADIFRVCGVFKTGLFEFDSTSAFMSRSYFDDLMYAKNRASYITLRLENIEEVEKIQRQIVLALEDKELEVLTWKELMHSMVESMEIDSIFGYISLGLFFVVIFFVIMIFGFINVSSRIREFGTLEAIGVKKSQISQLLFYEIFILSTLAVILATPLGAYIAYYYSVHPIVIEGMSEMYKEYGIVSDELPTAFSPFTISWNVGVIYLLNLLSILYPLSYVSSFKPIEALHHV